MVDAVVSMIHLKCVTSERSTMLRVLSDEWAREGIPSSLLHYCLEKCHSVLVVAKEVPLPTLYSFCCRKSHFLLCEHKSCTPDMTVSASTMMKLTATGLGLSLFLLKINPIRSHEALIETERLAEYHARNYSWPPLNDEFHPPTPGWTNLFRRRFSQIDALDTHENSYNGYMGSIHSALRCPNFTEFGYGLTKAPEALTSKLKAILHKGILEGNMRKEDTVQCIVGDPYFIDLDIKLIDNALIMLKPIVEAWSGTKLVSNNAYGLRVYRNESSLNMHIDKVETHVLSAILHVDHDEKGEPWPIVIEDFQGNTVEVSLESGDMLLYESSKCYHGRPRTFNGEWYASLFLHWYPVDWDSYRKMETHYRVPPIWDVKIPTDYPKLNIIDTSLDEPDCQYGWCALKDSVRYSGPAPGFGKVMAGGKVEEWKGFMSEDELTQGFNLKSKYDEL